MLKIKDLEKAGLIVLPKNKHLIEKLINLQVKLSTKNSISQEELNTVFEAQDALSQVRECEVKATKEDLLKIIRIYEGDIYITKKATIPAPDNIMSDNKKVIKSFADLIFVRERFAQAIWKYFGGK